jgi:hypothetical protein
MEMNQKGYKQIQIAKANLFCLLLALGTTAGLFDYRCRVIFGLRFTFARTFTLAFTLEFAFLDSISGFRCSYLVLTRDTALREE